MYGVHVLIRMAPIDRYAACDMSISTPQLPMNVPTRYNGGVNRPETPANATPPGAALIEAQLESMRDDELLQLIAIRHEPALGVLYDRYIRLTYAIALRITGDRQTAEEVVQDTFQNIWQTAGSFRSGMGSSAAWLLSIARHRAIDATRSKRERARSREQLLDPTLPISDGALPEQEVEQRLQREQIRMALGALPPNQRRAIELAYYGGLSRSEIAESLGEPLGTVKTRLRLGLLKLQALLQGADDEESPDHDNAE